MSIVRETIGGVTVLRLHGELFGGDLDQHLRQAVEDEAALGNAHLVLDLSGCSYVNSWGLGTLIEARVDCVARGGGILLSALPDRVARMFQIAKVVSLFAVYLTVEQAITVFSESSRPEPG